MNLEPVTLNSVSIGACVAYVPTHLLETFPPQENNLDKKAIMESIVLRLEAYPNGCQIGFVTSFRNDMAFVRYYYPRRVYPKKQKYRKLRNKANSEGTYYWNIYHCHQLRDKQIRLTLEWIAREEDKLLKHYASEMKANGR